MQSFRRGHIHLLRTTTSKISSKSLLVPAVSQHKRFYAQPAPVAEQSVEGTMQIKNEDKILRLVDEISQLSLLEASSLVDALKTRLNIKDIVAAHPVMPAGMGAPQSGMNQMGSAEAVEAEEPKKEQTEFSITLESFDAAAKAKVIREMKNILPNANLIEAKKFVESAPKKIMENISKEQVEKIKAALEAVGAKVKIE